MGIDRDYTDDPIVSYLKQLFLGYSDQLRERWTKIQTDDKPDGKGRKFKIYTDLQEQLQYTPAIEIVSDHDDAQIFAIGSLEERGYKDIICTVENNHPEVSGKYLRIFSKSIFDLLNAFENRQFQVPGHNYCAYYSEASSIQYGFRRGKGLKSAKITWSYKLLKANRTTFTPKTSNN